MSQRRSQELSKYETFLSLIEVDCSNEVLFFIAKELGHSYASKDEIFIVLKHRIHITLKDRIHMAKDSLSSHLSLYEDFL